MVTRRRWTWPGDCGEIEGLGDISLLQYSERKGGRGDRGGIEGLGDI